MPPRGLFLLLPCLCIGKFYRSFWFVHTLLHFPHLGWWSLIPQEKSFNKSTILLSLHFSLHTSFTSSPHNDLNPERLKTLQDHPPETDDNSIPLSYLFVVLRFGLVRPDAPLICNISFKGLWWKLAFTTRQSVVLVFHWSGISMMCMKYWKSMKRGCILLKGGYGCYETKHVECYQETMIIAL